jgi:single-stranded DNA-specific DHH superfamily exonuclease
MEGIGAVMEDGFTLMEEEHDGMIVEEHPKANDEEALDKYLNMELRMGAGMDDERWGRVIKRAKDIGGEPVGRAHPNPFFDTREYEVKFTNGTVE